MTATSKSKSYYEQVLSKIYARRLRGNNQQKCIYFSNQDQINMSLSVKNVVAMNFMCPIIKVFHLEILSIL